VPHWSRDLAALPDEPPLGWHVDAVPDLGFHNTPRRLEMSDDKYLKALIRLAKLMGMSVVKIDYVARMIAQADVDPLPPREWGEPFEFGNKVAVLDDDDFLCINPEVPQPDAQVDLLAAWNECMSDFGTAAAVHESGRDLSLSQLFQLASNGGAWFRFLVGSSPSPSVKGEVCRML
jgi:hypothetical protein